MRCRPRSIFPRSAPRRPPDAMCPLLSRGERSIDYLTDLVSTGKSTLLFGPHDTERNKAVALADYLAALIGIDIRDRKLAQVVVIACRWPEADVIVRADVGAEAERPPDGTHVRRLHQLGALLVAKVSFEPD